MAKPLQGREMSAVNYISVSVLLAGRCQAVQLNKRSLETRLKQLQRLEVPDLFWQPVPCQ